MLSETYQGRKLKIAKGREWGTLVGTVNGTPVMWPTGTDEEKALAQLRAQIDYIDQEPVTGERWGAEWYAPGTYTICERTGIHPVAPGGECEHSACRPKRAWLNGA